MIVTIVVIAFLPWLVKLNLEAVYDTRSSYAIIVLLITLYPCGLFGLVIENEIRRMFRTLEKNTPFIKSNVRSLNIIALMMALLSAMFIFKITMLNSIMTMVCAFVFILISISCHVLAKVFDQAVIYKEDNDLTI